MNPQPTEFQLDALKEIVNIGIGNAASSLNNMLDSFIALQVPTIHIMGLEKSAHFMTGLVDEELSSVQLDFHGSFTGSSALVFPCESAVKLVNVLTGAAPDTIGFEALVSGTLNEVGNIVINGVIGSISNLLSTPLDFSLPYYLEGQLTNLLRLQEDQEGKTILVIKTNFVIENLQISGHVFIIFEISSFDALLEAIENISHNDFS